MMSDQTCLQGRNASLGPVRDNGWGHLTACPGLPMVDVHVWYASLDQAGSIVQRLEQTLDTDDRRRANRFITGRERQRFIVGRGLLRVLLGYYSDTDPSRLQFCYGYRRKPSLAATFRGDRIRFNLAHSNGFAIYAVTLDREIGVDIEPVVPIPEAERIANRFFSEQERDIIRKLVGSRKDETFLKIWTCKEAYLKARGDGLCRSLSEIDVSVALLEPNSLLRVKGESVGDSHWSCMQLRPNPGFVASLVVEGYSYQRSKHIN